MISSPQLRTEHRTSYRSPETAKMRMSKKIEAIYNSLKEHKSELGQHEQLIDIYTPELLIRILDMKVSFIVKL